MRSRRASSRFLCSARATAFSRSSLMISYMISFLLLGDEVHTTERMRVVLELDVVDSANISLADFAMPNSVLETLSIGVHNDERVELATPRDLVVDDVHDFLSLHALIVRGVWSGVEPEQAHRGHTPVPWGTTQSEASRASARRRRSAVDNFIAFSFVRAYSLLSCLGLACALPLPGLSSAN